MLEGGVGERVFSTRMSRADTCSSGDASESAPEGVRALRRPKSKLAAAALLFWHRVRGLEVVWVDGQVRHGEMRVHKFDAEGACEAHGPDCQRGKPRPSAA